MAECPPLGLRPSALRARSRRSSRADFGYPRLWGRCIPRSPARSPSGAHYGVTIAQSPDFYPASAADSAPRPDDENIVLFLAEEPGDGDPIEQVSQQITALARIATSVAEGHAVLWVITCDAQQATLTHSAFSPVGGALWSLGRVLVNEMPRLSVRLLDLPGAATSGERAELVAAELVAATVENEIVWTPQGRHVLRLRRGLPTLWATPSEMVSVGTAHVGGLDALGWELGHPNQLKRVRSK